MPDDTYPQSLMLSAILIITHLPYLHGCRTWRILCLFYTDSFLTVLISGNCLTPQINDAPENLYWILQLSIVVILLICSLSYPPLDDNAQDTIIFSLERSHCKIQSMAGKWLCLNIAAYILSWSIWDWRGESTSLAARPSIVYHLWSILALPIFGFLSYMSLKITSRLILNLSSFWDVPVPAIDELGRADLPKTLDV